MKNLPVRMARWSAGHPWRAIVSWLLFVVLCLGVGITVGGNPATTEDFRIGEAGRAEALAAEGGLQQRPVERVLITARPGSGPLDLTAADAAAKDVADRMRGLDEVRSVADPVHAANGTAVRVDVTMNGPELDGKKHVDPLLAQTAAVRKANPDLRVEETGSPSISKGVDKLRGDDLSRTEVIALPVTLITLLLVFSSLVMALVPLLLALSSIAAAVGLSMLASHAFPDAGVGTNVILLIGLAVGVDYTLFYLKREREERARAGGRLSSRAVVELAAATSGRAVVLSGLAVAISSATLFLADDVIFSSIATGAIVVTLVAVLSSLTVLPALLAKLGERAERRAVRREARAAKRGRTPRPRKQPKTGAGRLTTAVLSLVGKRPAAALSVTVIAMLALAAPVLGLKLTDMGRETHSRSIVAMQVYDRLNASFPELKSMHQVVVRADADRSSEVAAALRELAADVKDDARLSGTSQLLTSPDKRITMLQLQVPYYVSTDQAQSSLKDIRKTYVPETVGKVAGAETAVTGDVARYTDYPTHQEQKLPLIIGALLLVTFAMTVWAFRSLVLGLVGVLLNLLSAAASLGVLVLVFQDTWAEGLLDFDSTGSIGSRVPLFLFVILFGLSMDYQVFVISRVREAALNGVPTRKAVIDGIGSSAGVVTSAAVVMVTVFASFAALHLIEMKQIGFSLAVAVLLDAFVIRMLILPALMLLLGEANWWPSHGIRRARDTAHAPRTLEKVS
ncbi:MULTISPECIES: MMPL family transporter [unclassified Streptomyces]|uniref:MMPL family transporter n=1 Tax=unclassified Streptomyces TaxID=2593676 RepID=UPI001165C0BD|nr:MULTISPECIES: MMPL family transporter [unclassified Streptomyces]NMI59033.1 MMPL family transporter [Streptomyces sp. RLA2-12]QDN58315.1 MMPL family transporter [Streptomyces sp. S1D4-20]QDN68409.1 MMPL family transporter [Streptomyces sp. S1D4-14]QDO50828.1 MMPL family transporter [Streptomyces sp. RLB3-5]QDO61066.1 MMPL family transporter [Streptomyces sp. RLB1-8]